MSAWWTCSLACLLMQDQQHTLLISEAITSNVSEQNWMNKWIQLHCKQEIKKKKKRLKMSKNLWTHQHPPNSFTSLLHSVTVSEWILITFIILTWLYLKVTCYWKIIITALTLSSRATYIKTSKKHKCIKNYLTSVWGYFWLVNFHKCLNVKYFELANLSFSVQCGSIGI